MSTATKQHYLLSPSAAHRWLVCPGEPALRLAAPNVETEYAREGTTAHWVGERSLLGQREPYEFIGKVCPETGMTVTDEMAVAVKVYVDYCRKASGPSTWQFVESKFTLPELSKDLGGTSDYGTGWGSTFQVVDYKHGSGKSVQATNNPQLRIYGLGGLKKLKFIDAAQFDRTKRVVLDIVQPRIEGEQPLRQEILLMEELFEWRDKILRPAIQRTIDEPNTYVPGDHCFFCPAKATCPVQYKRNLEIAQQDFSDVPVEITTVQKSLPAPASLTIQQIARIVEAKDLFTSWLGACEGHLQHVLEQGQSVPGFKLVKKRANRAWSSEQAAKEFLVANLGDAAYAPREILTVAQAEKALKVIDAELAPALVVKPDNGCVIAAESDKRAAFVPVSAAEEFAAIDVEALL